eukprot:363953-Chlamydomonas_euryale.AAC.4
MTAGRQAQCYRVLSMQCWRGLARLHGTEACRVCGISAGGNAAWHSCVSRTRHQFRWAQQRWHCSMLHARHQRRRHSSMPLLRAARTTSVQVSTAKMALQHAACATPALAAQQHATAACRAHDISSGGHSKDGTAACCVRNISAGGTAAWQSVMHVCISHTVNI